MVVFTYLATTSLWASISGALGLSANVAAAVISVGQSLSWSLAASLLTRSKVSGQQVQATISQTDAPRIRAYGRNLLGGQRVFFESHDDHLHQIIVAHHGQVDGLIRVWIDGEPVSTEASPPGVDGGGRVNRYLAVFLKDGSGEGGDYGGVFDADGLGWSDLTEAFPALWTPQHRLQNQATIYSVFGDPSDEDFVKYFPKGAYTVVQAEVRGSLVRDLSGAMVYSENAGLCIRDLMTHVDGWNIPVARLDTASWQAFVNLCGQAVQLADGGTEMRYRLCGFYSLDDALKGTTARMLATCDGQIYETAEGKIGILGGQWSEPDVTITADDILSIEMTDGYDPFTDYNVLKGSFVSPLHAYQSTEVAELRDEASLATQEERVEQYDNDMVPSNVQMQRLMKIKFAKDRREHTGTIRTNLVGLKARWPKGDGIHTIRIVAEEFGIDGVFEVTSHAFSIPDGYCDIGIASIANPYGWTAAEERPLPPSVADLGKPDHTVLPPQNPVVVQQQVLVSGAVQGVKLVVTVDDPGRESLTLKAQVAQGEHAANSTSARWVEMPVAAYRAETGVLDDRQSYTVRVKWAGRTDWIVAGVVHVVANPTPPDPPTAFSASRAGGATALDWRNAASGFWRTQILRNESNDSATATVIASVDGVAGQVSSYEDPITGTGQRWYWARTVNASGVTSILTGPETVTL